MLQRMFEHRGAGRLCGLWLWTLALSPACDDTTKTVTDAAKQAGQTAQQAADRTQKAVDDAKKAAGDVADSASKKAGDAIDVAKKAVDDTTAATARAWAGLSDTGELSKSALSWLSQTASEVDINAVIAKGKQVAPVALEIGKTVNAAVDSDTAVEPIYQSLEGRDPADVDKAISGMPRVEVIDGLKVGFSQLNRLDAGTSIDERAYLLTWRSDTHLVGLVYRTKRTIDIELLVKEAPRLVALTTTALASEPK